jgi:hypothetical protein
LIQYLSKHTSSFFLGFLVCLAACQKDSNPVPHTGDTGYGLKGFLKQYRLYYPASISPDSVIVDISYDTSARTILLKQDFTGEGPTAWWQYQYNRDGNLTSVFDTKQGSGPNQLIDSFTYDENKDLVSCLTYENKIIPYTTSRSASGKTIMMYDTSYSGFLGGTIFGTEAIIYNTQNQLTDRILNYGGDAYTTAKVNEHENFLYDGSNNITQYSLNQTNNWTDINGTHFTSSSLINEIYSLRDNKINDLYIFENLLLKGVVNLLSGNALIDPMNDIMRTSKTLYFQNQNSVLLNGIMKDGLNFSNQPVYDSLGRLINTSMYDYQLPGVIKVQLSYF